MMEQVIGVQKGVDAVEKAHGCVDGLIKPEVPHVSDEPFGLCTLRFGLFPGQLDHRRAEIQPNRTEPLAGESPDVVPRAAAYFEN